MRPIWLLPLLASCAQEPAPEGLELLSPRGQLIRLSVDLRGIHPSETELQAIEDDPGLYEDFVDRYLDIDRDDQRLNDRMVEIFNQRLLTRTEDTYGLSVSGADDAELAERLGDEPLELLRHVFELDLPYTEMVLADYTMADPLLAAALDLDHEGEGWQAAWYTDGRPHVGILSMSGTWLRYPSAGGNANRHRANAVSKVLMCDDYLTRPIVLDRSAVDQLISDPESAISENASCQSCHATLDPLAAHFFGFFDADADDSFAWYLPENEEGWRDYADKSPGFYGIPTTGLAELGIHIADDPRFVDCAVQTVFEGLTQRTMEDADWEEVQAHRTAFTDAGLVLRPLVRSVVTSDEYRAQATDDPELSERLATVKLASPAQLADIVEDLTEYRWSFSGQDGLTTETRGIPVLLGGIDGDTVTVRNHKASVGAVLTHERLAQAAGWHVASHDLDPERQGEAILLEYVTIDDLPDDAELFEAQMAALMLHITGYPLDEDAAEPAILTALWADLYTVEGDPEAAWAGIISAILRDPRVLTY